MTDHLRELRSKKRFRHACGSLVLVTERVPEDGLFHAMNRNSESLASSGIKTLKRIGDCLAPGIIAAAVYSGHLAAREFEAVPSGDAPFLRERIVI